MASLCVCLMCNGGGGGSWGRQLLQKGKAGVLSLCPLPEKCLGVAFMYIYRGKRILYEYVACEHIYIKEGSEHVYVCGGKEESNKQRRTYVGKTKTNKQALSL